ncbi:hypothetical protein [Aeromonas hydrophila]|uniref:hypothetical protein n=1 Tax=Aeromonas hydrophila TaxID=644 RepID=UPI00191DE47F|nr:hypothetical protein [Aeromonas hydrophila]MBL0560203.1 hypothetical protein [Aeromonas hydrophila]
MLDVYQRISALGDKNSWRQWVFVMIVSQKYRSGPVFNLGCVPLNSIFMAGVGDSAPLLRYLLFFARHPSPDIHIYLGGDIQRLKSIGHYPAMRYHCVDECK